jgi:hypothetical protein
MAAIDSVGSQESVVALLDQAARTIDLMWRSAQMGSDTDEAWALGEASHGVHRALIALDSLDTSRS